MLKGRSVTDRWAGTFARRSATVVPEPRAVPAFKVVGAAADVVERYIEAVTAVLAGSVKTVVHGQLRGRRHSRDEHPK